MAGTVGRRTFLMRSGGAALVASWGGAGCRRPGPATSAQTAAAVPSLVRTLEEQLPVWMRDARLPGLGLALIRNARVVWQRSLGMADVHSRSPIDRDTIFEAASMSKPVFAYAVLQLHEAGVLDLDTPLIRYDDGRFIDGDPRLDLITARQVLSHTSGLPAWRSGDTPLALLFTPGERWSYSGEGYYWLQSIVTRLTGRTDPGTCATYEAGFRVCGSDIDGHLRTRVLVPLGMASSGYLWNDTMAGRAARPHDAQGAGLAKTRAGTPDVARYASAGGLQCTVSDYAAFLRAVIDPPASDGFHLRSETMDTMVRPVISVSTQPFRSSWALGWQILHTEIGDVIAHGGDNTGFHSFAAASRARRSGFVAMTNGEGGVEVLQHLLTPQMLNRMVADQVA